MSSSQTVCFVCNLPILSHQVGLVWKGGNGLDEFSTPTPPLTAFRGRFGRRDSATQLTCMGSQGPYCGAAASNGSDRGRRRSSLAQLTDIIRDWSTRDRSVPGRSTQRQVSRRESLADLARNLPWSRKDSSADSTSSKYRRRRESVVDVPKRQASVTANIFSRVMSLTEDDHRDSYSSLCKRRDSKQVGKSGRIPSLLSGTSTSKTMTFNTAISPSESCTAYCNSMLCNLSLRKRDYSNPGFKVEDASDFRNEDSSTTVLTDVYAKSTPSATMTSTVSTATGTGSARPSPEASPTFKPIPRTTVIRASPSPEGKSYTSNSSQISPEPDEIKSDSPNNFGDIVKQETKTFQVSISDVREVKEIQRTASRTTSKFCQTDTSSQIKKETSQSNSRNQHRLRRQSTFDESQSAPSSSKVNRRGSRPFLSPDASSNQDEYSSIRKVRRDSLSPDSAAEELSGKRGRRDSRPHLSPDSDSAMYEGSRLRRQSTTTEENFRRQSTTEEILIARGFRRQSTTEEMLRCRNFRRQSTQSEELSKTKGRRDSAAQITDGTIATMTAETSTSFYDTSTQTEDSSVYDNNFYHEECLRCNSCGVNLTGPSQKRARRFKNQIFCDLHFADVALMECSDFMQQLRSFKPQSLGCAVARRKSSTTLIFPLPPQACSDEFCEGYPHNFITTPGYWIECSRPGGRMGRTDYRPPGLSNEMQEDSREEETSESEDKSVKVGCDEGAETESESRLMDEQSRKKTTIEEQYEKMGSFELTSVEQETYERYFYGTEHWNYFTNDEDLGPVVLSLKQEIINGRDQFRILVRGISYAVHGLIPASCVFADRYNREEVVRSLGNEINLHPPLRLGQLPDTPEELLKLDQVFIKSELKVGVIYVKDGQYTEEEILDNNEHSPQFEEFIHILGEKCRLKGFDKYKGGLDTVHDLTGLFSVYTNWRGIEIMFHVSTLLPYEKNDPQKLQRKRHVGNDIVCVVFLESDSTKFSPACIKSHFLHTFILVKVSPKCRLRPTRFEVSVVSRDEVGAFKPYLWEQSVFYKGPMFREWLLAKIVNGERASYSAPKFARMQERTRSQMLEDIVANLQNHADTGQIPKPYRRGSWRPIGHMRPSSPLLDSVRDQFEGYEQLAKDFNRSFHNQDHSPPMLFDVTFLVGQGKNKSILYGVRAILGVRSRVFQEMLYGICTGFGSPQVPVAEILARAVPTLHSPSQRPKSSNFLQVPDIDQPRPKSVPNSPMVIRAFSRLGNLTSGWSSRAGASPNVLTKKFDRLPAEEKKWASTQDCSKEGKENRDRNGINLAVPRLSVCADIQKIDRSKLAQTEFTVIEFDPDTFRLLLNYLHTGSVPLTCSTIPGLICAAEHYDLPDLLQACFHHAKQFLRIEIVCVMLTSLENYYWRYTSASELVNMILSFIETRAGQVFNCTSFLSLSESMVQMIMARNLDIPEIRKFEAMVQWGKQKVRSRPQNISSRLDAKMEFRCIMERLSRDLRLYRISPQDLIKVVLPSKAIKNERILETLMFQANSGMYRVQDAYLEACQQRLQKQDSRFSEWDSFDHGT
ncbi:uncharacterized protein LOC136030399 isoform X2 [Artemia franciscana]|uniref:uncharacterized protein LOC136030399 isoform X2 n=1 Tax=Artemia franciscana TaxID=6661 RepID=UPI0032DBC882